MTPDKKVGIIVDNYKLERFEKALDAIGLKDRKVLKFNNDCKLITITCKESRIMDIARLCKKLEIDIKRSN